MERIKLDNRQSKGFDVENTNDEVVRIATSKLRWFVLGIATSFLVAVGYNRACFGVVDNIYVKFFDVSTESVDWLTLIMNAVSVFACLTILAVLPFCQCGLRLICLVTAFCIAISYACHLVSALSGTLFALSLIGQISMGISHALSIAMVPLVGAIWFPKEEVATAVGICLGGIDVGNILGFNVPAHLLHEGGTFLNKDWTAFNRSRMLVIYASCFTIAFAALLIVFLFLKDEPVYPPSLSHAVKAKLFVEKTLANQQSACSKLAHYFRLVCSDMTCLALIFCFGLVETCYMLEVLMMSDILRVTHRKLDDLQSSSNELSSHILSAYAAGGLAGGVVSGVILDKTKRYKLVAVVSGFCMTVFSAGFLASVATIDTVASFVTNTLYGFFNGACYTALYEIIAQHMYPCEELALGAWITCFLSLAAFVVPLLGRFLFNKLSSVGVLSLQTSALFLSTIIISLVKPRYERYSVNLSEREIPSVSTPLVKHVSDGR